MVKIFLFLLWHFCEAILFTAGSCAGFHRDLKNPSIWYSIKRLNPDAFIWLGDAIYSDRGDNLFQTIIPNEEKHWKLKYDVQKNDEGYKELRESTRILGVWDDHDYGPNNSDKNFPYKELSKKLFLDFIDEPKSSKRYQREGLYDSYYFTENDLKIKIILLDDRTFMDPSSNEHADVLGEIQWKWLENELSDTVDLYLIMNGLQINVEGRLTNIVELDC
ncbi:unnamed protein product [Blepharisma stoltei]|uniref:PhoD-like phosphatase metallophosphatase domain-containing protein n=1 Tax=Blepharisma stoltei TaxID=1481888 RepID=A0AAU9IUY3_9CILI|nr:unnamed protein product [Blepharisma stoltei]